MMENLHPNKRLRVWTASDALGMWPAVLMSAVLSASASFAVLFLRSDWACMAVVGGWLLVLVYHAVAAVGFALRGLFERMVLLMAVAHFVILFILTLPVAALQIDNQWLFAL